ncbi:MAG: tyrosine-type recombinase/integrase [Acidimicrobiales bacterium]
MRNDFGSVRELPSGKWQATWKANGARHRAPMTFRNKTDAKTYLATVRADLERGTWTDPLAGRITVREVGAEWLASNPNKSDGSIDRDRRTLNKHVYPEIGYLPIGTVDRSMIQAMVNGWTNAPSSIARQYSTTAALFNFAVDREWIPRSPCRKIPLPTVVPSDHYQLSADDVKSIYRATSCDLRPCIAIGATTGMRWAEIFFLRVEHLDLDGRVPSIRVAGGITRGSDGKPKAGKPGSRKAKPRVIPIGPTLVRVLSAHIADRQPGDLLFPDGNGNLMRYNNWYNREWLPTLERAGLADKLPRPGIHDLRRMNATQLAGSTDVKTWSTRLGLSPRVGLDVYARPIPELEQAAGNFMDSYALSHVGRTEGVEMVAIEG